jgi:hypothetical protein
MGTGWDFSDQGRVKALLTIYHRFGRFVAAQSGGLPKPWQIKSEGYDSRE